MMHYRLASLGMSRAVPRCGPTLHEPDTSERTKCPLQVNAVLTYVDYDCVYPGCTRPSMSESQVGKSLRQHVEFTFTSIGPELVQDISSSPSLIE